MPSIVWRIIGVCLLVLGSVMLLIVSIVNKETFRDILKETPFQIKEKADYSTAVFCVLFGLTIATGLGSNPLV